MRVAGRAVAAAVAGALFGVVVAGTWWLNRDAQACLGGGCGTPAGDATLLAGGAAGAAAGLALWCVWRLLPRRPVRPEGAAPRVSAG